MNKEYERVFDFENLAQHIASCKLDEIPEYVRLCSLNDSITDPKERAEWFDMRGDFAEEYGDELELNWCRRRANYWRGFAEKIEQGY